MSQFRYPYPKRDGTIGYRRPKRKGWAKWYTLEREKEGELVGSLQTRFKRCGKENCRCASGRQEDLHGPYYHRLWYENGERRREYVRLENVDQVREKIERRQRRLYVEREERHRHMRRGEGGGRGGKNAYQKFQEAQLEDDEPKRIGPETLDQKLERLGFRQNEAGRLEWNAP